MKAFLGTGLLGSNFVKSMLKKGDEVCVWNRTYEKAKALEASGAKVWEVPADAVKGASVIHLTLKDDASVDEVLSVAEPAIQAGTIIFDHTTTSVAGAKARTQYWREKGYTYIHAPVFMGPQNALDSTGYMLVSGEQDLIAGLLPLIEPMTGKVINFGDEIGKAAAMKLLGNLFLIALTGGMADMLSLARATGVETEDITTLFAEWNPGNMVLPRLKRMTEGNLDQPSWELAMARKDAGLMMQEAEKAGRDLTAVPAIARLMDKRISEGLGQKDWTIIGRD